MARPHVPKFGNWDASGGDGASYTAVFDGARAGKGSKMMNPNDPEENQELAAQMRGGPAAPPQRQGDRPPPRFRQAPNDADEAVNRPRREGADVRKSSDPPGRASQFSDQPPARRAPGGPGGRGGAEPPPRRAETGRGPPGAAWDRRGRHPSGGDEGAVLGTNAAPKPRLRPQAGREEPPAKGGALPKFGAWDVKDPNAGDGFTMIFQKLSNEKKEGGPVHIPRLNPDQPSSHEDSHHQPMAQQSNNKYQQKSQPACCTIL